MTAPPPSNGRVDWLTCHWNVPEPGTVVVESSVSCSVCGSCTPPGHASGAGTALTVTTGSTPIVQYGLVLVSNVFARRIVAPAGAWPEITAWSAVLSAASPAIRSASRRPPAPAGASPWTH